MRFIYSYKDWTLSVFSMNVLGEEALKNAQRK